MRHADAILTADIEIRSHTPICRTDDHWTAQAKKIKWLRKLQKEHACPIFDAGDLFDKKYKTHPSHQLLSWAITHLPLFFYTIPGNHDLPGKSIENYDNSAMAVLERATILKNCFKGFKPATQGMYVYGYPWGAELKPPTFFSHVKNIALVHAMVYKDELPWPGCEGHSAQEIMDLLPGFDLIVTGHHHATFTHRDEDRILVNPGSFMRNDADQIDHEPCVFLWYADAKRFKRVYVPIEQGVISREHIEIKNTRANRLDAFVEKLGEQAVEGVDFHRNLENAVNNNNLQQPVIDKVWQYYEGKCNV